MSRLLRRRTSRGCRRCPETRHQDEPGYTSISVCSSFALLHLHLFSFFCSLFLRGCKWIDNPGGALPVRAVASGLIPTITSSMPEKGGFAIVESTEVMPKQYGDFFQGG